MEPSIRLPETSATTPVRRAALGVVALLGLAACSGGAAAAVDGGAEDAAPDAAAWSGPAQIPWLAAGRPPVAPPVLTPCPAGWRTITADDVAPTCEPWPETGRADCAEGEAHFPGTAGCAVVGDPCPAGDFPEGLPAGATVIYVRPGAAGGDGSLVRPFGTIRDAIAAGRAGAVVALAKGTYDEVVRLGAAVTVWGACARDTLIRSSLSPVTDGVVWVGPVHAGLRNVTIARANGPAIRAASPSGELTARGVVVREASVVAVEVRDGATLDAHDFVVERTRPDASGTFGWAIQIRSGGHVSLARAVLRANAHTCVSVSDAGSLVHLEDTAILDTASNARGLNGGGLSAAGGAAAEVSRSVVEGSFAGAVAVWGAGTSLVFEDGVVRDTRAQASDGLFGTGISVHEGATGNVARTLVERATQTGVLAEGAGATLRVADLVVRDTRPQPGLGSDGQGVLAAEGAVLDLTRAEVRASHLGGVESGGTGSVLTAADVVISGTLPQPLMGIGGHGLIATHGGTLTVARVIVERSTSGGVLASTSGTVSLEDALVDDTLAHPGDGTFGHGVHVQGGASCSLTRVLVSESHEAGVLAAGAGCTLMLADVVISATRARECATTTCADSPGGFGLASLRYAQTTATRFQVEGAPLCGVLIATDAQLDLSHGLVAHTQIGACVQIDGYDTSRLDDDVRYEDVVRALESTTLPVPDVDF